MDNNLNNIFDLFKNLNNDIKTSVLKLNECEEDYNFYARSYLRAYASWIEGNLWMYKHLLQHIELQWHKQLPIESQLYLFEYDWKIQNGKPVLDQKKIKTKENLKAFFNVISQLFNDFEVDLGTDGWKSVMEFYTIRDRTMHPTDVYSLTISKEEIKKCDIGRVWLEEVFQKLRDMIYDQTNV